jgi:hypothetical protein
MTELTPEKIKELTALMASAPPQTAARLLAMFERMKVKGSQVIPSNDLIIAMREAGMTQVVGQAHTGVRLPSFERLFFEPFENLFENGELETLLPGSLPRAGLKEVWQLIASRFAPDEVLEIEPLGREAILAGDVSSARKLTNKLRDLLIKNLNGSSSSAIANCGSSPSGKHVLSRLKPLLLAETKGRDIWMSARGSRGDLNEQAVNALCSLVRSLEDSHPDAARELLLLTMCTLPRPAEALRVLARVSLGVDDRKLDMTEFSVLGRRVLAIADRSAALIQAASQEAIFDGVELAAIVDRYNQSLLGLEREAHLGHDGPWRKAMLAIRSKVGNRLEELCQSATLTLQSAMPIDRVQRQTVTWTNEPRFEARLDQIKLAAAKSHMDFIAASRLFAPIAGFGAARERAAKHATGHIEIWSEALLKVGRQKQRPLNFNQWVQATANAIEALDGVGAAHVFERRIAACAVAA